MNPFEIIGYILGAISLVGAAVLGLNGKVRSTTADVWKDQAEAFKADADRLAAENKTLKLESDTNRSKAEFLQDINNGRADFKMLSELMTKQHGESTKQNTEVVKGLSSVTVELSKLTKAMMKKET